LKGSARAHDDQESRYVTPGKSKTTTVGVIHSDALAFTAGNDIDLDLALVEADCLGTAAHAVMLSRMPVRPPLLSGKDIRRLLPELRAIIQDHRKGRFRIRLSDQDVHLAVERWLTKNLGELGKKIHTGRSRNDQVALDVRLYAKDRILNLLEATGRLSLELTRCAKKHVKVPMVGRTHMQKAMPSSVALWASAYAEGLLDDLPMLLTAYEMNDQNPLGSAAGYGVPLPIDRDLVTRLLGMSRTVHNVLHAGNMRGKLESMILQSLGQIMITLSRLSQDLMIYSMPEFDYVKLPSEYCTGSSIMPQKNNPDVLELVRARTSRILGDGMAVLGIITGAPSGYNRDLQEIKEPFLRGLDTTQSCVEIMSAIVGGMRFNTKALTAAFTPDVFATDYALELVGQGVPFRDAYREVKKDVESLSARDPKEAIARKTHVGATAGLALDDMEFRAREALKFAREERRSWYRALSRLLGAAYPGDPDPV
jgi:argininosuccinate lyase